MSDLALFALSIGACSALALIAILSGRALAHVLARHERAEFRKINERFCRENQDLWSFDQCLKDNEAWVADLIRRTKERRK